MIADRRAVWNNSPDRRRCQLLKFAGVFPSWYPDEWLTEDDNPQKQQEGGLKGKEDYSDLSGTPPGQSSGRKLAPAWLQTSSCSALLQVQRNLQEKRNYLLAVGSWNKLLVAIHKEFLKSTHVWLLTSRHPLITFDQCTKMILLVLQSLNRKVFQHVYGAGIN